MDSIDFLNKDAFKLIEKLLERRHYLRELADEENLAPSQVHKIMAKLASRKIVLAEMQKNRKFFSL
ncbi:MAG: hypothetical protein ABID38_06590, partial [Candidatus Diapherotrites archaeon]